MNKITDSTHKLCSLDELTEGESRGFRLDGFSVFAIRKQGEIYVYHNSCPHNRIELEWLEHRFLSPEKTLIQCASHGAQFIIETGLCVAGPCAGESLKPIPYRIENNEVFI